MRILLTADPMIPVPPKGYGGIERIVDALIRAYRTEGHEVALVARDSSTAAADARFGWPVSRVSGVGATIRNALALRKAVGAFRPDVVHSFSRLAYLLPLLRCGTPVVMSYQRHTGGRQTALAARLGRKRLRFTGCSEYICGMGRPHGGTWSAIPNFIEPERFTFCGHVPADAPLVFLSRVEDIKGPDTAITIARASGRRLIIAGNRSEAGPQRDFFDREIQPWIGREGIEWIGEVNDEQKNQVLGSAAALVVPIRWDEPFGIVFAEALACGTPVITCARGAIPEIVIDGTTGFLIRNVDEGSTAVRRLEFINRSRCRRDAEERFSAAHVANRYVELYSGLVGRTR